MPSTCQMGMPAGSGCPCTCPACMARKDEARVATLKRGNVDRSIALTKTRAEKATRANTCYDCGKDLDGCQCYERNADWGYYAFFCKGCDDRRTNEAYNKGPAYW